MLPVLPQVACHVNTFLTWFSNGLLIFLIVQKSPKVMANYRYLMLSFAIFGVLFGIVEITDQAFIHFFQGSYIVFSGNPLGLPRRFSFWHIAFQCSCYGVILFLLGFHFIYRYLAVCKQHLLYLFSWPFCNIFIGTSIFITLGWSIATINFAGKSEYTDEYIEPTMLQTYSLKKGDYTYVSTVFYRTDPKTLAEHLSIPDLLFVAIFGAVITLGFSIIVFCWLRIRSQLIQCATQSKKTLEMQRQLFNCLISQTILPVCLMFVPATIMFVFPLFKVEPGVSENLLLPLITTQPFMDALVPMYFITEYRKAILRFSPWKCGKSRVPRVSTVETKPSVVFTIRNSQMNH